MTALRKHLKWIIPVLILFALGLWIAADTLHNLSYEKIPARPPEKIDFNENGLLQAFAENLPVSEAEVDTNIGGICSYIDGRYDCADFRMVSLLRILYLYPDRLSESQYERIRSTLLNFKYWMDEPGDDSMCYWSENHQILFATAELLAGQLWPDEIFTNNGMTGLERQENAKKRINYWMEQRWNYGFTEWYSNVYYVEDIGPLSNLIDFAEDDEISMKATIIMDLLLYDLASQSWKGVFISNSGRLYEGHKKGGAGSSMRRVSQEIFGYPQVGADKRQGMELNFLYSEKYQVPDVIRMIGRDESPQVIRASNGLDVDELKSEGLLGQETKQIMMQWAMESFTNPETITNTIDTINRYGMLSQTDFNAFSLVNYGLLRYSGLLPVFSRVLNPQSNGVAIQRSDSYMFRTENFSLSTSQAYHPGTYGDQQHIWQATLSDNLSIFTTHPAILPDQSGPNGNSPGFWVGSGRLPHSVQDENINLTLYRLPEKAGVMEKTMHHFTHLWFPEKQFDEVILEDTRIFGRVGNTYVAVSAGGSLEYRPELLSTTKQDEILSSGKALPEERNEVVQEGRDTWWITEISTAEKEGNFQSFINRISGNHASFDSSGPGETGTLFYNSRGRNLQVDYDGDFRIDNEIISTDYMRFDAPWAQADRKPEAIRISADGHELYLDFSTLTREIR